jgi:hypothetical protein
MNGCHTSDPRQRRRVADEFGGGVSWAFGLLFLLLLPGIVMAQAPAPEEALDAVVGHLRDSARPSGTGRLGFDSARAARFFPNAVLDAAAHREILARIAEARELPFYPGEDFGRVACDASSDPEWPGVNCRFVHGTGTMLTLTVISTDEERGVTRVDVFSVILGSLARRSGDEVRAGRNTRHTALDVEYDRDGSAQVILGSPIEFAQGFVSVDEIRGTPPGT